MTRRAQAERIRTTHAGSLPRPEDITQALVARAKGEAIDQAWLNEAVRDATRRIIAHQIEAGLDLINNGEVGRESFFTYVRNRMSGFSGTSNRPLMKDLARHPGYLAGSERARITEAGTGINVLKPAQATGDVVYADRAAIDAELAELSELLDEAGLGPGDAFVSAPSPGIIAAAMENKFYESMVDYVAALGKALAVEYRAIIDAGFTLQIDAPDLALERHTLFQDKPLDDFRAFSRLVLETINANLGEAPRERVRLHVCWGNYEGPHDCDVALADIWDQIAEARVGGFMLSMANPRHAHEYRLFRDGILPGGTTLISGVIDTTTNYVEHPETVADRLECIAEAVGDPARIMAGTDCGFETAAGYGKVNAEIVWAKLRSLGDGAALASQRLFGS
jgi:5-methyltetrahydropteroyltriglutamate--homocysteine methyltransferase